MKITEIWEDAAEGTLRLILLGEDGKTSFIRYEGVYYQEITPEDCGKTLTATEEMEPADLRHLQAFVAQEEAAFLQTLIGRGYKIFANRLEPACVRVVVGKKLCREEE